MRDRYAGGKGGIKRPWNNIILFYMRMLILLQNNIWVITQWSWSCFYSLYCLLVKTQTIERCIMNKMCLFFSWNFATRFSQPYKTLPLKNNLTSRQRRALGMGPHAQPKGHRIDCTRFRAALWWGWRRVLWPEGRFLLCWHHFETLSWFWVSGPESPFLTDCTNGS